MSKKSWVSGTDEIIAEFLEKEERLYWEESTILLNWYGYKKNARRMFYGNYTTQIQERVKLECSNYRAKSLHKVSYKIL